MEKISLAEAKANLSKIIDRVEAGACIDITRRGKAVARLTAISAPRSRIDATVLRALTTSMARQEHSAGEFVRDMRDGDRS